MLSDAALAGLLAITSLAPLLMIPDYEARTPSLVWSLVMCSAVVTRRVAPMVSLGIVTLAGVGMAYMLTVPMPALLAVPVVVYSVARYRQISGLLPVVVVGVVASVVGPMSWTRTLDERYRFLGTTIVVLLCAALVALAYLSGRYMRERVLNATLDREIVTERFTAARRQSEQESQLVTGRARAEVAQELHDVLAHSLSVIVVQAEGAKALTNKRPEAAVQALTVIADTGRRSIEEVRRIVSLMRGETESARFGPAPTLTQIPDLVAAAGDRITLTTRGETPVVPESLGLAAYRIVQEATTNFLKHAGPTATARVLIEYRPDDITITVSDDGIGSLSSSDGHGSGLAGMRERVTAMGGSLEAGPRPGGGYEVRAGLPMPNRIGKSWLKEAYK
ncbi:Signal transduction histidine kinase [Tessaracoccus bendigoensis DSM 12906]|uniref:histidine kinase n=1 Tax=Tessaracoccus bendigoensis DSM 12906 TaxID=1123357 RepID=A0A1M6B6L2_9ACTN|nr:Signal transduction histidine kinase [Tessaracoccus bendigoensis DSM 12906]